MKRLLLIPLLCCAFVGAHAANTGSTPTTTPTSNVNDVNAAGPKGWGSQLDVNGTAGNTILVCPSGVSNVDGAPLPDGVNPDGSPHLNPDGSPIPNCRAIINTSNVSYFVPWNTDTEWQAFLVSVAAGKLPGVTTQNICGPIQRNAVVCQDSTGPHWGTDNTHGGAFIDLGIAPYNKSPLGNRPLGTRSGILQNYATNPDQYKYSESDYYPKTDFVATFQCIGSQWVQIASTGACSPAACADYGPFTSDTASYSVGDMIYAIHYNPQIIDQEGPAVSSYFCAPGNTISWTDFKTVNPWEWVCHGTPDPTTGNDTHTCDAQYVKNLPLSGTTSWDCGTLDNPFSLDPGRFLDWNYNCTGSFEPGCANQSSDVHGQFCSRGTAINFTSTIKNGHPFYTWQCAGIYGGATSDICAATQLSNGTDGVCGPANGTDSVAIPSLPSTKCYVGGDTLAQPQYDNSGTEIGWTWQCLASYPATNNANCSARKTLDCAGSVPFHAQTLNYTPNTVTIAVDGIASHTCQASVSMVDVDAAGTATGSPSASYMISKTGHYTYSLPIPLNTIDPYNGPVPYMTPCYAIPNLNGATYTITGIGSCAWDTPLNNQKPITSP